MIKLFFHYLFKKPKSKYHYVVDFECALPIYLASRFRKINYIYDIYDEFAIRYAFPNYIRKCIKGIDKKVRKNAFLIIHVDNSRVSEGETNYIIIPNIPFDYYNQKYIQGKLERKIAISGYLSETRGVNEMFEFAKQNSDIDFLISGRFTDPGAESKFKQLKNVYIKDFVPQESFFTMIKDCCAIMALYDPRIEINRKAASNKLYDSLMLGIPIITNRGLIMSEEVEKNELGIVIDYNYNKSWEKLTDFINDKSRLNKASNNCRNQFESKHDFQELVKQELISKLM